MSEEFVILVDSEDNPIGTEEKVKCHLPNGKLHRAFTALLFDKTGTLTKGDFGVTRIESVSETYSSEEILRLSSALEQSSEHPIAVGIIKKVKEDIERLSFNTSVSAFMICANELTVLKCNKEAILRDLVILLSSFAPFISEELWNKLGNNESISHASFPTYDEKHLIEDTFSYPVSFNGKTRFKIDLPGTMDKEEVEKEVLAHQLSIKWLDGKVPKRVIVVEKRIINIVV